MGTGGGIMMMGREGNIGMMEKSDTEKIGTKKKKEDIEKKEMEKGVTKMIGKEETVMKTKKEVSGEDMKKGVIEGIKKSQAIGGIKGRVMKMKSEKNVGKKEEPREKRKRNL